MRRAEIFITNKTKDPISVGMTKIPAGKTKSILAKDFERKASYIDRMIKENKLSFANPNLDLDVEAPVKTNSEEKTTEADASVEKEQSNEETVETGENSEEGSENVTNEADASAADEENKENEEKVEETVEEEPETEEPKVVAKADAPKTRSRKK